MNAFHKFLYMSAAVPAMRLDYDGIVERISQQQGTRVDPHDPWNVGGDYVGGMAELGLGIGPLERPAAAI